MKVCLVVCLALAHHAAASIFKRHHDTRPPMQALNLPLTYIEPTSYSQYSQQLQYQRENQKQAQRSKEDRAQEYQRYQDRSSQELKPQDYQWNQDKNSQEPRSQEYQKHQDKSSQELRSQDYQKYQDKNSLELRSQDYQRNQDRSSQELRSQESRWYPSNDYLNPETAEVSSHEAAEQIRVNIVEYQSPDARAIWSPLAAMQIPSYPQPQKPLNQQRSIEQQMQQQYQAAYGDNVEWNGIRMAVGPHSPIAEEKDIARIFDDAYKTVKDFTEEEQKAFHEAYMTAAKNEDTELNATQLLQKHEYAVEEHTVKTDDGYILTMFRIPPKQKTRDVQKRPVVFLMHGLLGSADDWLLTGPGVALAYLLADAEYDVWMGNARGNKYSRRHVSKHPAQPDFWQFSNDEIALHDLPAMIDYALNTTHQEKMYYVGFSEGTTTFFALASSRPQYNDKIIMMYALSPMVYMSHTRSPLLKMIAPNSPFYEHLHQALGHGEFKPSKEVIRTVGGSMLANKFGCKHVAANVNLVMAGMVDNYDPKIVPMIASHLPAGGSTRQMKQYGQAVATHDFRRYDYGPSINQKVYGSEQPAQYDMSEVRAPVSLYYSAEDWLAQPADVERLKQELPMVVEAHQVPQFSHLDFQFSKAAPEAVYQRLIASIQKQQEKNQE